MACVTHAGPLSSSWSHGHQAGPHRKRHRKTGFIRIRHSYPRGRRRHRQTVCTSSETGGAEIGRDRKREKGTCSHTMYSLRASLLVVLACRFVHSTKAEDATIYGSFTSAAGERRAVSDRPPGVHVRLCAASQPLRVQILFFSDAGATLRLVDCAGCSPPSTSTASCVLGFSGFQQPWHVLRPLRRHDRGDNWPAIY